MNLKVENSIVTTPVFVYGTLREGEPNHRVIEGRATLVDTGYTNGSLFYHPYGKFPIACIEESEESKIHGELYQVTLDALQHMDQLEGHPDHYRRVTTNVTGEKGSYSAFMYVMPMYVATSNNLIKIESGDWKNK